MATFLKTCALRECDVQFEGSKLKRFCSQLHQNRGAWRAWHSRNRAKHAQKVIDWRHKNPDKVSEYNRKHNIKRREDRAKRKERRLLHKAEQEGKTEEKEVREAQD